jgi:hypothetical protein
MDIARLEQIHSGPKLKLRQSGFLGSHSVAHVTLSTSSISQGWVEKGIA